MIVKRPVPISHPFCIIGDPTSQTFEISAQVRTSAYPSCKSGRLLSNYKKYLFHHGKVRTKNKT